MRHLEEGEIHAWLDGAVERAEAERIEAHAAACARCSTDVATARGLIAGASRILLALDGVPGGVIPAQYPAVAERVGDSRAAVARIPDTVPAAHVRISKRTPSRHLAWLSRPAVRIAAGLMLATGIGSVALRSGQDTTRLTVDFNTEAAATAAPVESSPAAEQSIAQATSSGGAANAANSAGGVAPSQVRTPAAGPSAVRAASGTALGTATSADAGLSAAPRQPPVPQLAETRGGQAKSAVPTSPAAPAFAGAPTSPAAPPPSAVADQSARTFAAVPSRRDSAAGASADRLRRLESRVTTGAAGADLRQQASPVVVESLTADQLGGSCFALESAPGADSAGVRVVPRRLRIQLAQLPGTEGVGRSFQGNVSADNVQALGLRERAVAPGVAPLAAAAPSVEPADVLPWRPVATDSVVARWTTVNGVVELRLEVAGDSVTGTAVAQTRFAPAAILTGRKVVCGG